eukprot:CAMPEP_0180488742 /NCGR_PEP_ID=MMETSP1036_2-20121128/38216_1 /TAXON_ID=632150 /ORGANISM="Azadinium spinosum, Strain 3D9" /LENGTH=56 /DNA_ID=CAMNT_0022496833 /DNA_START=1 /DNA_END=168 /DNA_ORIENTATION=+
MWDCDAGNENQQWSYNRITGLIKNVGGLCLDADPRDRLAGKVQMWDCDAGNENQQW